jgi:hypothetical protein
VYGKLQSTGKEIGVTHQSDPREIYDAAREAFIAAAKERDRLDVEWDSLPGEPHERGEAAEAIMAAQREVEKTAERFEAARTAAGL